MQSLLELLEKIPNVVWSGIIASVITLLGVFVSNRDNTKRLRLQLEHDGHQKTTERKVSMRRDVYLKAAEEIALANSYLGSLMQVDLAKTNVADGIKGLLTSLIKVSVVGEMETVRESSELGTQYGIVMMKLIEKLQPIQSLRTDIEIANSQHAKSLAESERLAGLLKAINESGQLDANRVSASALLNSYYAVLDRLKQISANLDTLYAQQAPLASEFSRFLMGQIRSISEQSIRVVVAARMELGIESDMQEFIDMLKLNQQRILDQVTTTVDSFSDK